MCKLWSALHDKSIPVAIDLGLHIVRRRPKIFYSLAFWQVHILRLCLCEMWKLWSTSHDKTIPIAVGLGLHTIRRCFIVELPSATAIKKEPDDPQTVVPLFEVSLEPQIELLEDSGPDKRASDVAKVEPFLEYDPLLMVPQSTADYSTITTITQSVSTGDRMSLTSLTSSS